ncbi:Chitinase domain-containing protein 1 [Frankliniella fusca]|uniref:Chitinase domain-containing protein 1 n=1 Tax=Frankliniella fusca TaxID=407009 RepID=A0AAE1H5Z4_9NEOP|nr:Chitinase domain-containing protein 1 [Frankliniella fusca]
MMTLNFVINGILLVILVSKALSQHIACVGNGTLPDELLVSNPRLKDIAAEHKSRCSQESTVRNFEGISLGYITPWNNHGYDIAKWFGHKFTHISPVWLQIRHNADLKYKITGTHDIDPNWISEVKKNNIKMVPRILFDGWTPQHIEELEGRAAKDKVIKLITSLIKKHNFDGIVLEGWMQLIASGNVISAMELVKLLSVELQALKKDFILVIPPIRGPQTIFGSKHFDLLADTVTAFSIMTYDYSSGQRNPGPTSPVHWMKECVELIVPKNEDARRSKVLVGLNFYGYHFTSGGPEAILGNQFIDLTKSIKGKMKLDKQADENFVEIKTKSAKHTIYYPTLYSIKQRIRLAEELGVGIAIWELGQGLDYFYELL